MGEERGNRVRGKRQGVGEKGHRRAVADRRRLFMVHCKKDCPLKLASRMAWSFLLLETRHRRTASRHNIHKHTGLGRKAADAAARELVQHGLAEKDAKGRLFAVSPTEEKEGWFASRKAKGSWHDQFAYLVVPTPAKECPLTSTQNAILWCLIDQIRFGRRVASRGMARMVGCDRRTISQALGRLCELKLTEVKRRPGRRSRVEVRLLDPPRGFSDWYRTKKVQEPPSTDEAGPRLERCLESWVSDLADRGFRDEDMARVRQKLGELDLADVQPMPHLLDPILEDAEKVHSVSGQAHCCVNLLLFKINRWASGRVAVVASSEPAQQGPVMARLERQETEELAALAPLAEFDPVRYLPCPACGESVPHPYAEQRVPEDRLSAAVRAVLEDVRRCLPPHAGLALPETCLVPCRCRLKPSAVAYVQITFPSKGLIRHVLLPKDWEAAPQTSERQPPSSQAAQPDSAPDPIHPTGPVPGEDEIDPTEKEFLEGLDC